MDTPYFSLSIFTYCIIGEGQLIGEAVFLNHLQQATISAVTDTTLITCPIQSLYPHICRHSELNRIISELLTENYTQLCNQIKGLYHQWQRKKSSKLSDRPGWEGPWRIRYRRSYTSLYARGTGRVPKPAPHDSSQSARWLCKKRFCMPWIPKNTDHWF